MYTGTCLHSVTGRRWERVKKWF